MKCYVEPQEIGKVDAEGFEIIKKEGLEAWTGADAVLTPLPLPLLPPTLPIHLEQGACLVQIKRGHDFSSSIVDGRINHALAKMRPLTKSPAQRIILFQGEARANPHGDLLIDNRLVKTGYDRTLPFSTFQMEILKIAGRGGTFVQIERGDIGAWGMGAIKTLKEMQAESKEVFPNKPEKTVFVDDENPLQDVRLIPDAWVFLASLPGVGPKMVKTLVKEYGTNYAAMLTELTDPRLASPLSGIGKGKISAVRHALNLKPWEYLGAVNDLALMQELHGFDEYRCETCPRKGEDRMFPLGEGLAYCDQECQK